MANQKRENLLNFALDVTDEERARSAELGVGFDDETREIAKEIVFADALDRVFFATDYFDASINRISAWITGLRSVQKAFLYALLMPADKMKELQNTGDTTALMVLSEEVKELPFGDIWNEYLSREGVEADYITAIKEYEKNNVRG